MKRLLRLPITGFLTLLFSFISKASTEAPPPPGINEVIILTPSVEKNGKFEAVIDLTASFTNPFDYDQIVVSATFTSPEGGEKSVDGFYMQDYNLNTTNGTLSANGSGAFRVRFAPNAVGNWTFSVSVTDETGTVNSDTFSFLCTAVASNANHGFVRNGASNYLQFEDGEQYIPIGENMSWQNNNPYLNFRTWLEGLIGSGGNFFRLWHAHWGLGIEWSNGNGFLGLRNYKQTNCFYQDWLYDYCAENGVYIMLALQHHGPVSTQVNPNWNDSPYNTANGGPCQNTAQFFTNEEAREHTKNRYRYIIARWGYARSVLCWELFNEVHWTDNFEANQELVAEWHFEMANFLKTHDPYDHIVTTSYGGDLTDEDVWLDPDFGLTQSHIYINTPNIERVLASTNLQYLEAFDKPTLNGEFGLGTSASLANQDPDGIHIHNALWGGLFSGGLGSAMTWWWDNYIHPQDLYYHFTGLSMLTEEIPFVDKKLAPASTVVNGAPGDLALTPSLGWSSIGESDISIDENGSITPVGAALGQFLYGSQWNTQYRSPPTFTVNYPAAGSFTVITSTEAGQDPKITIWLDGQMLLDETGTVNSTYTIEVPAGEHTIKVDNTGTDWITIANYSFEGLGSSVDAYVLVSEAQDLAAGWALNNAYTHVNDNPESVPSTTLLVEGFQDGNYSVRWYNPLTGALYGGAEASASGGTLTVPLPGFLWDVAFIVDNAPVSTKEALNELAFKVFPNPVSHGEAVSIHIPETSALPTQASLLDMSGRVMKQLSLTDGRFRLPPGISAGLYWLKMELDGKTGTKPLVVTE